MAVQKSKKTRSKIGMRRSHDGLKKLSISIDQTSGEKETSSTSNDQRWFL